MPAFTRADKAEFARCNQPRTGTFYGTQRFSNGGGDLQERSIRVFPQNLKYLNRRFHQRFYRRFYRRF